MTKSKTKTPEIKIYDFSDDRHKKLGHEFIKTSLSKDAALDFLHATLKYATNTQFGKLMGSLGAFNVVNEITEEKYLCEYFPGRKAPPILNFYSQNEQYFNTSHLLYVGYKISENLTDDIYSDFKLFNKDLPETLKEFQINMMIKTTIA